MAVQFYMCKLLKEKKHLMVMSQRTVEWQHHICWCVNPKSIYCFFCDLLYCLFLKQLTSHTTIQLSYITAHCIYNEPMSIMSIWHSPALPPGSLTADQSDSLTRPTDTDRKQPRDSSVGCLGHRIFFLHTSLSFNVGSDTVRRIFHQNT